MNDVITKDSVVNATDENSSLWYDAAVIGGGVLGCFVARNLMRWNVSAVLIEAEDDVCNGITRANSAIVYTGYDNKPGSLKARLTVQGNKNFAQLCEELEVPFSRCGSLLVAFDAKAEQVLHKKYHIGIQNGVQGLQLLTGDEVIALEPMLLETVTAGLYAPDTGTVNPWQLGIAACENAAANGCCIMRNEKVMNIQQLEAGYLIKTENKTIYSRTIINCAGINADHIHSMLFEPEVYIEPDGADYLVMDKKIKMPKHIIFHETAQGKGITAVPCTEGNLLLESATRALTVPFATTEAGMRYIRENVNAIIPQLDLTKVIRSFGAVRPNLCSVGGDNFSDF